MTQSNPPKNPIAYAEDHLGLNEILSKTIEAREELDRALTVLAEARDAKRLAEEKLKDREMDIAVAERGKHSDLSATAMKEHLGIQVHKDESCRELRIDVRELTDKIDGAEMDRKILERDIEIGCARMNQLGGYFNYLASVKNAATAAKATREA